MALALFFGLALALALGEAAEHWLRRPERSDKWTELP